MKANSLSLTFPPSILVIGEMLVADIHEQVLYLATKVASISVLFPPSVALSNFNNQLD